LYLLIDVRKNLNQ